MKFSSNSSIKGLKMAKLRMIGGLAGADEPQNSASPQVRSAIQQPNTESENIGSTPARWSDFSVQLKSRLQQADNFIPESPMPEFDPILHQQNLNRKK
jgi:hypothetical protein